MLRIETKEQIAEAPKVYQADDAHYFLNWIAEGTDGALYEVPSEPGGWKHRAAFAGSRDLLKPVSAQKARAIARFVGGDHLEWGTVTIAQAPNSQPSDLSHGGPLEANAW